MYFNVISIDLWQYKVEVEYVRKHVHVEIISRIPVTRLFSESDILKSYS